MMTRGNLRLALLFVAIVLVSLAAADPPAGFQNRPDPGCRCLKVDPARETEILTNLALVKLAAGAAETLLASCRTKSGGTPVDVQWTCGGFSRVAVDVSGVPSGLTSSASLQLTATQWTQSDWFRAEFDEAFVRTQVSITGVPPSESPLYPSRKVVAVHKLAPVSEVELLKAGFSVTIAPRHNYEVELEDWARGIVDIVPKEEGDHVTFRLVSLGGTPPADKIVTLSGTSNRCVIRPTVRLSVSPLDFWEKPYTRSKQIAVAVPCPST